MSVTVAEILLFVNEVLHRSPALTGTDINAQIQMVLDDLSLGPYIEATDLTQVLTSTSTYLTKPANYFLPISIVLNDGSSDLEPLKPMPGGYKALREQLGYVESVVVSDPYYYADFGNYLWLYPQPGKNYTSRIDYYRTHPAVAGGILFTDEWKNAIKFGAAFEVACRFKLLDYISLWSARYEAEKEKMRLSHVGPPRIVGA